MMLRIIKHSSIWKLYNIVLVQFVHTSSVLLDDLLLERNLKSQKLFSNETEIIIIMIVIS